MKTALVVLDMLNDFVDGTLANEAAKPIIGNIHQLAEAARNRDDWVVIYANDAHKDNDFEFAVFGEHALAGSTGAEVVSELTPEAGDFVVPKRFYSAFTETDLDATCRVHNIGSFVVVGQHTNCCCRHTTYDAFARGIAVAVVSDATCVFAPMVGERYDEVQSESLEYLSTFYNSRVLETSELL
ncbi:MAG: isochorismatase family cysteine hydrolase [Acidimicrobiia bacterium]